jgi:pimeloyl-ACP methyl ester carboxylesterase
MRINRSHVSVTYLCSLALLCAATRIAEAQQAQNKNAPKQIEITCKDGLVLKATYFPSTAAKEAVPIVLLHGHNGSRQDLLPLAFALREQNHAVLAPDLRGHGESTTVSGSNKTLKADNMPPAQFGRMVTDDMESIKKFLISENNAERLNIDRLCLLGAEMGAAVAINWAAVDWSWPPLTTGKQGQDVKALILLSPEWATKGLPIAKAMSHPQVRSQLSVLIIVGDKQSSAKREAERLHAAFARFHPTATSNGDKRNPDVKNQNLFLYRVNTLLQGTKLFSANDPQLLAEIGRFIQRRLVEQPFPWKERSSPFGD